MFDSERLKGIDVFVATVAGGSFTAAADRLSLTSSAVGKSIARLEARLGARLFERTTRRLRLTEAGAAFHRVCVRVLDELESAERVLASDAAEPTGRLRVDVPATFGHLRVMPLLIEFAAQHPAVQPHVTFTDRFVDMFDEGIDLAVRIGGTDHLPANLARRPLGMERLIFCASPAYLDRRGTPRTVDDLPRHDVVSYGRVDGTTGPWLIDRGGSIERHMVESRFIVGHGEALADAVVAGLGMAQIATWLVAEHLRSGRLIAVLPDQAVDGLTLHLVWPLHKLLLPKVDRLLAHLTDRLRIE